MDSLLDESLRTAEKDEARTYPYTRFIFANNSNSIHSTSSVESFLDLTSIIHDKQGLESGDPIHDVLCLSTTFDRIKEMTAYQDGIGSSCSWQE